MQIASPNRPNRILKFGVIAILGTLVLAACHPRKPEKPVQNTATSEMAPVVLPPFEPALSNQQKATNPSEAVQLGLAYLKQAKWEFDFVYLYSDLQKEFGWPNLSAQAENKSIQDSLRQAGATRQLQDFRLFHRLIEPSFVLPAAEFATAKDVDAITVPALYCDHYPLDTASFFPTLRREADAGNYSASHAMLAFLWAEQKGCLKRENAPSLFRTLVATTRNLLGDRPIWTDLQLEAAALLAAAKIETPANWTTEIIALQNADGGWSDSMKGTQSDSHATILAMWFLVWQ